MPKRPTVVMTLEQVLDHLQARANPKSAAIFAKHGVTEPCWGVSFAEFYALQKLIGYDDSLAGALWTSGIHDARILATLIANPAGLDLERVSGWIAVCSNHVIVTQVALAVIKSPHALAIADAWRDDPNEWRGQVAWTVAGNLDSDAEEVALGRIQQIEREIRTRPNRTRYAMLGALIGIGSRSEVLQRASLAAADRIGTVTVDHGDTNCKTPNLHLEIPKAFAHRHRPQRVKR